MYPPTSTLRTVRMFAVVISSSYLSTWTGKPGAIPMFRSSFESPATMKAEVLVVLSSL